MKNLLQGFIIAFSMYSGIPMPRVDWNENNMKYCICSFPLIGAVIGACVSGWFYLAGMLSLPDTFRTGVLLVIPVLITGGIHLDGLLDTADALGSHRSREEKLAIMKDSHAGAFAVIAGICYFVLSYGIFAAMRWEDAAQVAVCFVLSRALSGLALVTFPKAKGSGLLRTFSDAAANRRVAIVMLLYTAACCIILILLDIQSGAAAIILAGLVFGWYYTMSKRMFGGITGDLAGCFLQICELASAIGVILL